MPTGQRDHRAQRLGMPPAEIPRLRLFLCDYIEEAARGWPYAPRRIGKSVGRD